MTRSPFREASESIDGVSGRCFSFGRGARLIQLVGKSRKLAFDFNSGEYQPMNVESLKKQLRLMEILVDSCKKHPAYQAIRLATGNCEP